MGASKNGGVVADVIEDVGDAMIVGLVGGNMAVN